MRRCLYCDAPIQRETLYSWLIEEDPLCSDCRAKLPKQKKITVLEGLPVETFYRYDDFFRGLLLQYKECYDEALKDVFLYRIREELKIRYAACHILYVPSTQRKRKERGFDHLKKIYAPLHLSEVRGLSLIEEKIQEGKGRTQRETMKENYRYEGEKHRKILIVDDVMTTGSSLTGVYRAVKPYAESVRAVCLARVEKTITLSKQEIRGTI